MKNNCKGIVSHGGAALGGVVEVRGHNKQGVVVGYTDQPTYTIETAPGVQEHWIEGLCRFLDAEEAAEYWETRARNAEALLVAARMPKENPGPPTRDPYAF